MSVRTDLPPLIANDGELAVVYQTAAYTWGGYSVSYPDGIEPEDFEAGRTLGYVGDLDEPAVDKGSRAWIRADVSVDASFRDAPRDLDGQGLSFHPDNPFVLVEEGSTEMFFVGTSTIPQVFDSAQTRTSGEIFVESIIGPEGMGHLVPGVDYVEGDIVPVLMGSSKIVDLPVAEITFVSRLGEPVRYEAKVGSALTGDAVALAQWNSELHALVAQETAKIQEELRKQEAQQTTDRQQSNLISISLGEVREIANTVYAEQEIQEQLVQALGYAIYAARNISQTMKMFWDGDITQTVARDRMQNYELSAATSIGIWESLNGG